MKTALALLVAFLAAFGIYHLYSFVTAPPYLPVDNAPINPGREPRQQNLDGSVSFPLIFGKGRGMLTVMARYDIAAKVEGIEHYYQKPQAAIAPHDICLSWGRLATEDLQGKVKFSQSSRWCHYLVAPDAPVDPGYLVAHAANVHLIYANDDLRDAVSRLDQGDLVELTGYLVYLDGAYQRSPFHWHSSLQRDDTGNGACELLYLTSLRKEDRLYGEPIEF
jgi:hypothetical protein